MEEGQNLSEEHMETKNLNREELQEKIHEEISKNFDKEFFNGIQSDVI